MREFLHNVEAKVKAAAVSALAASLVLALLNAVVGNSAILGGLPAWLQFIVVTCVPTVIVSVTAWKARHTAVAPTGTRRTTP